MPACLFPPPLALWLPCHVSFLIDCTDWDWLCDDPHGGRVVPWHDAWMGGGDDATHAYNTNGGDNEQGGGVYVYDGELSLDGSSVTGCTAQYVSSHQVHTPSPPYPIPS